MISAIFLTENDEVPLAHALRALVPAAADGLIRDVIVVDRGSRDGTLTVADAAGCEIVRGRGPYGEDLRRAVEQARSDWLLFLMPGTSVDQEWKDEAYEFVGRMLESGRANRSAAVFRLSFSESSLRGWLAEKSATMRTRLLAAPYPEQGLLISKAFYRQLGGHRGEAMSEIDLARRIGRRHMSVLRSPVRLRHHRDWKAKPGRSLRNTLCVFLLMLRLPPGVIARVAG